MTDIPQEALDALMEIEAEAVAKKLGLSLVQARDVVKELWDEGALLRSVRLATTNISCASAAVQLGWSACLDALAGDAKGVGSVLGARPRLTPFFRL